MGITGEGAGAFSQTNSCATLSAGATCILTVTFTPSAEAAYAANLNISSNDPDAAVIYISLIGTGTSKMPVPAAQEGFIYGAVSAPLINTAPSQARPFGIGDIHTGTLSLRVGFTAFTGPVDIYLAIYAPSVSSEVWMIKPDLNLQPLSAGLAAWWTNTSGPVNEALNGDIALNLLPAGTYTLYTLVTPAGSLETYYLWSASFNSP